MQTIRLMRTHNGETVIPGGYRANGWSSVLPHEMNVLFHALCYLVAKYDSKEEMIQGFREINALNGTFDTLDKAKFKSEESYENYINLLETHKEFLKRSNYEYPQTKEEAIELMIKWGLVLDQGDVWDVPVHPFPEAQDIFVLNEREKFALDHLKLESLIHPIFSKLILHLHEQDDNHFSMTKAEMKKLLDIEDTLLMEVLVKLIPYLKAPIENLQDLSDTDPMEFTVEWEKVYEDFLGGTYQQNVQ
ncbi:hypothetical protein EDM56_24610 [Brevibacillus fluminis]|uniref:Uncharacterized protein n=1 Tax=Brevibacillus fluminis TaxID=511487 RepID=A0A3M8D2X6_9BACL|nr:DUF6042 family protein [Brevibacillus fluminis]RNB82049.1 hypothetical protein EDM56_24610 [Brevibacillus fluminis]